MVRRTSEAGSDKPKAPTGDEVPNGGLEKIEAAEALGADPPNPGGTVIGGEGTAEAQRAEAAGGDPLAAEAPEADAAASARPEAGADASGGDAGTKEDASTGSARAEDGAAGSGAIDDPRDRRIAELEEENERLKRSITAHKGVASRAKAEAAREGNRIPRRVAVMEEAYEEEGRVKMREAIDKALSSGADLTVVASDGQREVVDVEPVPVTGDEWRWSGGRKMFTGRVLLEPGDMEADAVEIIGFGLLAGDRQIAWSPLAAPVTIRRNQQVAIENSIAF